CRSSTCCCASGPRARCTMTSWTNRKRPCPDTQPTRAGFSSRTKETPERFTMTTLGQPKEIPMHATMTKPHKHNGEHAVIPSTIHVPQAGHEDLSAAAPRKPEE